MYDKARSDILEAKAKYHICDSAIAKEAKINSTTVGEFLRGCYVGKSKQDEIIKAVNRIIKVKDSECQEITLSKTSSKKVETKAKPKKKRIMSDAEIREYVWKNQSKPIKSIMKKCHKTYKEIMDIYTELLDEAYAKRVAEGWVYKAEKSTT